MGDNLRLLDFDDVPPVEVRLGGRSFAIRPQSASTVQKVLEYSSVDAERKIDTGEADAEGKDPRQFVRDVFSTWGDTIAATALMLSVGPDAATHKEDLAHLKEHLRPAVVIGIFEAWWRVNEIDDFLSRSGRTLMPLDYLRRLEQFREATTQALIQAAVTEAQEAETVETVH